MTGRYQRAIDLLELITLLQEGPTGFSIQQIADHFEVSRRTAERMLSALQRRFPELQSELRRGKKYWRFVPSGHSLTDSNQPAGREGPEAPAEVERGVSVGRTRWLRAGARPREALAGTIADALRGPISTVGMIASSALEPGHDQPEVALTRIAALAKRMNQTIERTLQLVRREPLKREPSSAAVLLQCAADEVRLAADASEVEIDIKASSELPLVEVDRGLLHAALSDLARNAIDAMPQGGRLTLTADSRSAGEVLRFTVEDTGPGIASGDEEWVFEPFYTTKDAGTGLGLTMVREIAAEHGGTVAAASSSDGGAVLTLEIPRTAPNAGIRATH